MLRDVAGQGLEMLGRDRLLRSLDELRQHRVGARIDRDDLVDDRPLEDRVQDHVVFAHRPRVSRGLRLPSKSSTSADTSLTRAWTVEATIKRSQTAGFNWVLGFEK